MTNLTQNMLDVLDKKQSFLALLSDEVMDHPQILIIDDNATLVEGIEDLLALYDYSCITATRGNKGVALFQQHSNEIDVVILDYFMPDLDGEQTFYALRDINPNVKVIFSSGYIDPKAYQRLKIEPLVYFLPKPFRFSALLRVIKKIIE